MTITKTKLLASAAVLALALGTASPAKAFDNVDWNWDKQVTSVENITITVNDTFDWSGLVEIEKLQVNIGDVTAESTVHDINNNPPVEGGAEGGSVLIDQTFVFQVPYEDANDPDTIIPAGPVAGFPDGVLQGSVLSGTIDEGTDTITDLTFQVTGEILFEDLEGLALDAVDLPEVLSAATAVANNQSITSTSAVNLHDGQFNFGGFSEQPITSIEDPRIAALALVLENADATDNAHTDAALGLTLAGALGIITPGAVSADSTVYNILNASVDSSATAVGNNINVNVEPSLPGDATLIADLTQFNYADVSATSSVCDVDINNYANLDVLDGPLVSSVATAVGNNVNISVGNFVE